MIIYFLTYNEEKVGTSLLSQVILVSLCKQDFFTSFVYALMFVYALVFSKREGDF